MGIEFGDLRRTRVADKVLAPFVEWAHSRRWEYDRAKLAVLGVQWRFKDHRGSLGRTWEALTTWHLQLPLRSRAPITRTILKAYSTLAFILGFFCNVERAHIWLPVAVMMRAGFKALLRSSEIGNIRGGLILLPFGPLRVGQGRDICSGGS